MSDRRPRDRRDARPGLEHLLSGAPAWFMATAFEVEAGCISLDQARLRLQQHGVRFGDADYEPAVSHVERLRTAVVTGHLPLADWLDPLAAWRALPLEVRERIGASAIAAAVANLGASIAIELADPIAHRHHRTAESEALSLIFELVSINVLDGDDTVLPPRPALRPLGIRQCRICGCTDNFACDGGCDWVATDLCSSRGPCTMSHCTAGNGEPR